MLKIITKMFLFFCVWVLASPQLLAAGSAPAVQTQNEKQSYSVGYEAGLDMKGDKAAQRSSMQIAQTPKAGAKQGAPAAAKPIILTITGKIAKGAQGYIIQGKTPPELFTILNPNPSVLDKLVASGETVTIEAVSVMGDNVDIQKIGGKAYKEAKEK
jgi:hypothetical protein